MKKTTKLLATVAALGALATATYSFAAAPAQDAKADAQQAQQAQCPMMSAHYNMKDMMDARFEGLARMLTLEENQKAAWNAYVDASKAMHLGPKKTWDKPAVDTQDRLERRIEMATESTEQLKAFTKARADLLKVLNPSQKYVLEQMEMRHGRMGGGMGGHGGMMGGHGMMGQGGMMQGHGGMMMGQDGQMDHGQMMGKDGKDMHQHHGQPAPKADAKADKKAEAKM